MKDHNEFDELARRKLEERRFAVDEAGWLEVERQLDKKGGRRLGWWLIPALALLLPIGYLGIRSMDRDVEMHADVPAERSIVPSAIEEQGTPIDQRSDAPSEELDRTERSPIAPIDNGSVEAERSIENAVERTATIERDPINDEAPIADRNEEARNVKAEEKQLPEDDGSIPVKPDTEPMVIDPIKEEAPQIVVIVPIEVEEISINDAVEEDQIAEVHDPIDREEEPASTEDEHDQVTITGTTGDLENALVVEEENFTRNEEDPSNGKVLPPAIDEPTGTIPADQQERSENESVRTRLITGDPRPKEDPFLSKNDQEVADANASVEQGPDPVPQPTDQPKPNEPVIDPVAESAIPAVKDTASIPDEFPNDAASATPELPAAPPIVDPRSPLEIAFHGGTFFSNSTYSGAITEDWDHSTESTQTFGGGVELMRMGRNIGIGGGLHFSTYAERLNTDEALRSLEEQYQYYFLDPVDTTILYITDTIIVDGVVQYVGESINTTINVIDVGTGTQVVTTRLRDARQQVNRTSYLEIPLLIDFHLTQGKWNIGLRGGPSLGLLSFRRGALPNSGDAGYIDLSDQQFRSLIWGYNARAYIRYGICPGWTIGAGPMIKGQLSNGIESEGLMRRSSSIGGVIGISYRFK